SAFSFQLSAISALQPCTAAPAPCNPASRTLHCTRQTSSSGEKLLNIFVLRVAERVGVSFEDDEAVAQHDEFRLPLLLRRGGHDVNPAVAIASRHVRRDVKGVAKLMGHDDRADVLEISQLDHL